MLLTQCVNRLIHAMHQRSRPLSLSLSRSLFKELPGSKLILDNNNKINKFNYEKSFDISNLSMRRELQHIKTNENKMIYDHIQVLIASTHIKTC